MTRPGSPSMGRWGRRLGVGVAVGVILLVGVALGGLAAGYRPVVIKTGSMVPTAPPGSLIIAAPRQGHHIEVGDVLIMRRPGAAPVTHRVIEIETAGGPEGATADATRFAITQGDANEVADAAPYPLAGPQLVARWIAPGWGSRVEAVFRPGVSLLIVVVATVVIAVQTLLRIWRRPVPGTTPAPTRNPAPAPASAGPAGRVGRRRYWLGIIPPLILVGTAGVAWALFTTGEAVPANDFTTAACFDAQLGSVQSGETIHAIDGTVTVPVTPVSATTAFVLASVRSGANEPADAMVQVVLRGDGAALELTRATDAAVPGPVTVAWSLVDYGCGVEVQRGTVVGDGTNQLDIPVTGVDPAASFVTMTAAAGPTATDFDGNDLVVAELESATQVSLRSAPGTTIPAEQTMAWQVVTFTDPADATTQTATGTLGVGVTSTTVTLATPVDVASTFLLAGLTSTGSGADVGERQIKATLTSPTTIAVERAIGGDTVDPVDIQIQVVTLHDGSTVSHGAVDFAPGETAKVAPVGPVDPTRASAISTVATPGANAGGLTDHSADDVAGEASATFALAGSTTVAIDRDAAAANASFAWQVIEWAGPRWWDPAWGFRQRIDVDTSTEAAPGGYTTSLTFDHAALVASGLSLTSGDDVRIVRWTGGAWTELDRVLDEGSSWNGAATTVWFQTVEPIAAGDTGTYWLYVANSGAGAPPADPELVYLLTETFESGTLGDFEDRTAGTAWYQAASWSRRIRLTVASAMVPAPAVDMPVRVAVTQADLGTSAQPDGSDLRFTAADGTTMLDFEIEHWDGATGELVAWVRIPSLSASTDTTLYLYYGAADAPAGQTVRGVWTGGFAGVWHLGRDPAGTAPQIDDATTANHDGLGAGAMGAANLVAGRAGSGLRFDGVDDRAELGPVPLGVGGALTVGAWANATDFAAPATVVGRGAGAGLLLDLGFTPLTLFTATARAQVTINGTPIVVTGPAPVTAGTWHHLAVTYDGAQLVLYLDGVPGAPVAVSGPVDQHATASLAIGAQPGGTAPFAGAIDEVRLAATARPESWIDTHVADLNGSGFVTAAAPEAGTWHGQGTWAHRKPITIDPAATDSAQSDLPVLIELVDPELQGSAQASALDIVFTAGDGTTRLDHVIEHYDGATGALTSWVRAPTLDASEVTPLFVYYGNPTAVDQQDPVGVFGPDTDLALLGSP